MITDETIFRENTELIAVYSGSDIPDDAIITPAGRRLYRHPSNAGSVIVYDYWGEQARMFIPDAKYRGIHAQYSSDINIDYGLYKPPRLYTNYFAVTEDIDVNFEEDNMMPFIDDGTKPLPYSRTDAWIQKIYEPLKDDGTSSYNTDILMKHQESVAAHACRAIDIPGVGKCDMPNLYQLIILYLESDIIDEHDPTVDEFPDNALGMKCTFGRFNYNNASMAIASTEGATKAWCVRAAGVLNGGSGKHVKRAVYPVKDL